MFGGDGTFTWTADMLLLWRIGLGCLVLSGVSLLALGFAWWREGRRG